MRKGKKRRRRGIFAAFDMVTVDVRKVMTPTQRAKGEGRGGIGRVPSS